MTPSQLRVLLLKAVPERLPILIQSSPGVGKTDIVQQVARELDFAYLASHPVTADQTEAGGFPVVQDGRVDFVPYGILRELVAATQPTLWSIEDLGNARDQVKAAFMHFLLAREVNDIKLPPCVSIVATTNRRGDMAASTMLEPVKSRFATIVELEPHFPDWEAWASDNRVAPMVIAFLHNRPELLCKFVPSPELVNSPSPRMWAYLSNLYKLGLPDEMKLEVFTGAVGAGAAHELIAYEQLYNRLVNVDEILANPGGAPIPHEASELYAVLMACSHVAERKTLAALDTYSRRLIDQGLADFVTAMWQRINRRTPALAGTPEGIKVWAGPVGPMLSGQ